MNWEQALQQIKSTVMLNVRLDKNSKFRIVTEAPPEFLCSRYNFKGLPGYKVQVGETDFVDVPFRMLEQIFDASMKNGGIYNRSVFKSLYPTQLNGKGCYVHVIGKIFTKAKVAVQVDSRQYELV